MSSTTAPLVPLPTFKHPVVAEHAPVPEFSETLVSINTGVFVVMLMNTSEAATGSPVVQFAALLHKSLALPFHVTVAAEAGAANAVVASSASVALVSFIFIPPDVDRPFGIRHDAVAGRSSGRSHPFFLDVTLMFSCAATDETQSRDLPNQIEPPNCGLEISRCGRANLLT
jgi:hypothetical protein